MNESTELQTQLARYQHILEQSPEYENLLLTLQRAGQAILPTLNEVDHAYLSEKLSALPQQFNVIVALAKDKYYKVQEATLARKEYASLIELTSQSLQDLEERFLQMSRVPTQLATEEALALQEACRTLVGEVAGLGAAVDELNQKKESFRSTGQPWLADKMLQLLTSYHRLKRQTEQRLSFLEDTVGAYQEHEKLQQQLQKQLEAVRAEQGKVNEETLPAEEKLQMYHALAGSVQDSGTLLKRVAEHLEELLPHLDPGAHQRAQLQLDAWREELRGLTAAIGVTVTECERRLVQSRDFQTEMSRSRDWLRGVKEELGGPLGLELSLQELQEEIRKMQIQQEEVQSRLRIMQALSDKETERVARAKELVSPELQRTLAELAELQSAVEEALRARQATLTEIYGQCQRYYQVFQAANDWLEDAQEMMQLTGHGLDVESAEENLKSHMEFFSTEAQFQSNLEELQGLVANLDPLIKPSGKEGLAQKLASLQEKSQRLTQDSHAQLDLLQRCTVQWQDYQKAREEVITLMNDAEKKLSEFSLLKTSSGQEAEGKLSEHKDLVSLVNSFHEKIVALEEKASHLEKAGSDASKATIGRSTTTVWQRWARLRAVAQDQEKILEDAVDEWKSFNSKVKKATEKIDELQDKLPGSSAEKASKTELISLLESQDTFFLELEEQQAALGMLQQQALSMLQDGTTPSTGEELPPVQEITAMQDRCLNMQEKIKSNGNLVKQELKEREMVETQINSVKSWVRETKEYLENPTIEIDAQLEELKILLTEVTNHRQKIEMTAEEQKTKYLGLNTILPAELSLQLAEVALDLGTIHDQIQGKVKEVEQSKAMSQEYNQQIQKVAKDLTTILTKLRAKTDDLDQARTDQKALGEELDGCNLKLMELDEAVQKFSEENGQLGKPLAKKIGKVTELHQQTIRQAENRLSKLGQAASYLEDYNEMLKSILKWIEKAKVLVQGKIVWNSASQLREQYVSHQTLLEESEAIHGDLEMMAEKIQCLASVYCTEKLSQQVAELGRETGELRQLLKTRLQSLQDAAKDMKKFETELRNLQAALEQAQTTLTSPEVGRLSLKEQLSHRQHLLSEMESLKPKVQAVQLCQSALRIPEDVVTSLPLCHAALRLQEEASRLQHSAIQQCNIMQEAVVQYEQYEQEMQHLQELIEGAHREIEDKPVASSNIQELQAQISRHEELAQKIKGYQEQIASLNSKCKMLTMKAKHATMLLTVTEVEGLAEGAEDLAGELLPATSAHPSVVMVTAGRCHTLLSPVNEESGEEGTNSEISSPPACRSPSPVANPEASVNQELYEPGLEPAATAKLDDLQRSWETLKNVISEKQRTLYEALERQQKYQDALQSISTKMEAIEMKLSESLERGRSPESQMAEHQALMDEILMLQEEISELQSSLADELVSECPESDPAEQLALQSTLTVLAERMSTIKMKASGKRQLLEEKLNEQLEEQRQEQALQRYRCEADELDHWLLSTKATLDVALATPTEPMDMEAQLVDCQNMLGEIEQKVVALSELSVHNENLLLEGKAHTRGEAEQLAGKLRTLKGSLLELQRALHDKQLTMQQGTAQEKEEKEADLATTQCPGVQEWLAQARTTWTHQRENSLQQQKELEQELAEQKNLLRSVASRGEEILTQHSAAEATGGTGEKPDVLSQEAGLEGEKSPAEDRMRKKWESLHQEFSTKQKLLQNVLEQEQEQVLFSRPNRLLAGVPLYKGDGQPQDKSAVTSLLDGLNQAFEEVSSQGGGTKTQNIQLERQLYDGVSATSTWLDDVEERLFVATALLPEETETCISTQETLAKDIKEMSEEMDKNKNLFSQAFPENGDNRDVIEDTLGCLVGRLSLLDSVVNQRCHQMKERLQQILSFQNDLKVLFTSLADNKYLVLQKLANVFEQPVGEQIEAIQQAEEGLKELDAGILELKRRGDKLQIEQPSLQELSKLQDMYDELMMTIGSRRAGLNQNLALKSQYEKTLQDLADLLQTGREKMAGDQKVIVSSKEEVQQLLDKHKEYFQGLESHMILTETLFRKIISFAVPRETQFHAELMAQASSVLKKAHKRGVELEYVLETWSHVEEEHQELSRQLEVVEGSTPSVGLVEESEDRLVDRIALYQHLKASLNEDQPKLYQVLDDGKRLLISVSCSELESQLNQLGERWLNNTNKVSKELHRLETILKHWTRYQSESAELIQWLQFAKDRLEFWAQQSVTVPQELEMVRDHLNAFLEFSKEVDAKSALKSSVLSTGNQLLRLKKVDTAALRSELSHIDTQWTDLLTNIPAVQEKLHQLQMDKLPSRHAISEVMTWISLMENVIQKDEDNIKNSIGHKTIHEYLQKYKGFKIDINCKQLTVDFVNQSVLQISSQDVESKRSDKTDFAEQLGAMNKSWQILQGLVAEKIQLLEGLLESWSEYENNVQGLKTWLEAQEKRLMQQHRIGDQASVQNALKDCQDLEDVVKSKEKEVAKVEQNGLALIQDKKEEVSGTVLTTLQELRQTWAALDLKVGQLKTRLESVLGHWSQHKAACEETVSALTEARYSLSRFRLLTGSLEAVQIQVDNLQTLQDDLEKQESCLQKFASVTDQLLKECHPPVTEMLTNTLKDTNMRWNHLLEEIAEQLHASKSLLQLWQRYKDYSKQCASAVQQQDGRTQELLKAVSDKDVADDEVATWIEDCQDLLRGLGTVKDSLYVLHELGQQLKRQVDASAASAIQSDQLSLSQQLSTLEQALCKQQTALQAGVVDYKSFTKSLDGLETWIVEAEEILQGQDPSHSSDLSIIQERMEELKGQMLKFSSMAPDLDRLNELGYRLPLNDKEIKRMQNLNRNWSLISSQTTERFSKLQSFLLQHQTFLEKCETWMEFLVQTEQKLAVEISGNYQHLLEQQRAHELFQAEMFSRQQILHSIIIDGQRLLEQGQVDDRDEFSLKLTLLSNQWQGVIRRAQQRRGIIDSQIRQWQRYREMAGKLRTWLAEVSSLPQSGLGSVPIPLQQVRTLFDEVQFKEKVFLRQQGSYILTVEAAKQLLLSADSGAEAALQTELTEIQEMWRSASMQLEEQKKKLAFLLKDWEKCEKGIADSLEKLRMFKKKFSQPLPDNHEELHAEQMRCKELENAVGSWTDDLAQLTLLKDTLCAYISAEDIAILRERLELLQRQWEELCHQLSLRRQQVSERLNEWAVFSEKNKELCEWLTQMESKVSQNGDILIEDMIEKLKKDYQEEIAAAQENKIQLQQMGERLAKASHESKASEIEYKLGKVNDRWQHLLDLMAARIKKLKETLVAVQQLDKNMSSLRSWLAHIESELAKPIVYDSCDSEEIQKKLNEQQDLQRDIEKHSTGVASVLNLCEVLLHDCDACATDAECDSIQQATRNLDRRWRNICAMSMERRLKIEETWRLWQKFLDDYSRFEDWLKISERTAAFPSTSGVLYTVAKEELKKFEAFQRQVHESLTQLELINKQYRRLARENRTDSACSLKQMVHEGNQRWDNLQKRVTSILRRLKHFIGQREEFETARDSILVWLTEMDLQLTNIEHFSECDVQAKIKQLKAFQQEISLNHNKIEQIIAQGEQLMEKSEPLDAAVIEEELDELRRYCQEVFGRVERYHKKLIRLPLADDEHDLSDRELELDDSAALSGLHWHPTSADGGPSPQPSSNPSLSLAQPHRSEPSGRDTPASVDSIPLEWDHDYDLSRDLESAVSGALPSEDEEGPEDKDFFLRGAVGLADVTIPESPEAYVKLTEKAIQNSAGDPSALESQIRQLGKALDESRFQMQQTEKVIRSKTPTGPELDSSYRGYMKLLGECSGSIDSVRRLEHKLKEEEQNFPGFVNLNSTETQTAGVIDRWELIQAQALSKELRMKQNLQKWQQFNSDMNSIWAWLGQTEEELEQLQRLGLSTDIRSIELQIKKLKELQKAVDHRKAIILSINLCSPEFMQHGSEESQDLQDRLSQMNGRWDHVCSLLDAWRARLQEALMQCQDFHEMSHGLLLMLENIDRRKNEIVPIDSNLDAEILQEHHKQLMQIRRELLESQLRVASLQDMSCQLLVNAEGTDCLEAKEKVHVIGNRLKLLLKEVSRHIKELERLLDMTGSQQDLSSWSSADELDTSGSVSPTSGRSTPNRQRTPRGKCSLSQPGPSVNSPQSRSRKGGSDSSLSEPGSARSGRSFLSRVLRAALPLQLLLLLLIGLACLVPMTEEDYSCALSNNFARSFHPMLRYTNGPPPL
ncbi:nesprin-1 isoform X7 [Sorex fumeus]|uniref:nesprin-1 isoform X7 n=1 Tax=Sorex fumeus TaxID=62283 RepID=UPI0024AD8C08|nr:nesprin-1 isoform X7 [Sorex fumeus]